VVADLAGAGAPGGLHAEVGSATATISAARNGHAERLGLLLIRPRSPDICFLLDQQIPIPAAAGSPGVERDGTGWTAAVV
jgi:hypothetical protein